MRQFQHQINQLKASHCLLAFFSTQIYLTAPTPEQTFKRHWNQPFVLITYQWQTTAVQQQLRKYGVSCCKWNITDFSIQMEFSESSNITKPLNDWLKKKQKKIQIILLAMAVKAQSGSSSSASTGYSYPPLSPSYGPPPAPYPPATQPPTIHKHVYVHIPPPEPDYVTPQ